MKLFLITCLCYKCPFVSRKFPTSFSFKLYLFTFIFCYKTLYCTQKSGWIFFCCDAGFYWDISICQWLCTNKFSATVYVNFFCTLLGNWRFCHSVLRCRGSLKKHDQNTLTFFYLMQSVFFGGKVWFICSQIRTWKCLCCRVNFLEKFAINDSQKKCKTSSTDIWNIIVQNLMKHIFFFFFSASQSDIEKFEKKFHCFTDHKKKTTIL